MPTKTEKPRRQRPPRSRSRRPGRESAIVAIAYLEETDDARETEARAAEFRRRRLLLPGDMARTAVCQRHVQKTLKTSHRLVLSLAKRGVRVNGVAPGPVRTPPIPSTFSPQEVAKFGSDVPLARAGEPAEIASAYVFLASADSSHMTGQVLHPNGGEIING